MYHLYTDQYQMAMQVCILKRIISHVNILSAITKSSPAAPEEPVYEGLF